MIRVNVVSAVHGPTTPPAWGSVLEECTNDPAFLLVFPPVRIFVAAWLLRFVEFAVGDGGGVAVGGELLGEGFGDHD